MFFELKDAVARSRKASARTGQPAGQWCPTTGRHPGENQSRCHPGSRLGCACPAFPSRVSCLRELRRRTRYSRVLRSCPWRRAHSGDHRDSECLQGPRPDRSHRGGRGVPADGRRGTSVIWAMWAARRFTPRRSARSTEWLMPTDVEIEEARRLLATHKARWLNTLAPTATIGS